MDGRSYNMVKLPLFSGAEEPHKGEVAYEVWNFEVKCLQNNGFIPNHVLLQAIRNSLKGTARSMLVSLGEQATVEEVLHKLDSFYGNVCTSETLMHSFYSDLPGLGGVTVLDLPDESTESGKFEFSRR